MNRTEIYKNGFSWPLLFSTIPIIIISIPGILTNIVLICVTIKNKALHGTTNFLLAQLAFYEIIHETGYFVVLYCNLIGLNSLTYSKASRLFSVPLFTVFGISPLMAFTGIDRLLYVIFPISFPKKVNPTIYLGVYTFICFIYCGLMTAGLIWFNNVNPDLVVSALLSDVLTGYVGTTLYYNISFILNNTTIALYIAVGIIVKMRKTSIQQKNRRLIRALIIIVIFNVGGFYIVRIFKYFILSYKLSEMNSLFIRKAVCTLLYVSITANAPVLYFISKEYKASFRRFFGLSTNQTSPIIINNKFPLKNNFVSNNPN